MELAVAREFFMWCTILHGGLLAFTGVVCFFGSEPICRMHMQLFSISKETFHTVVYAFILTYKLFFLVFSLIPWLVLLLVG